MTTENTNTITHWLTRSEIDRTEEHFADYSRRAQKRGLDITITLNIDWDSSRTVTRTRPYCRSRRVTVYACTISGVGVIGGWRLIGSATYDTAASDPIVRTVVEGVEFERNRCAHCGRSANRTYVTVIANVETGERMQVGRQCSKDFLGKAISPAYEDALYGGWSGGAWLDDNTVETVITLTLATVEHDGRYVRGDTTDTVDRILNTVTRGDMEKRRVAIVALITNEMSDTAREICDWISSTNEMSDYMRNLRAVASDPDATVVSRRTKLVASAVAAWIRREKKDNAVAEELVNSEPAPVSEWVGKTGEKRNVTARIERIVSVANQWGGTYLVVLRDADGNAWKTFTTAAWIRDDEVKEGTTLTLAMTIKGHDRYGGEKQTLFAARKRIA